MKKTLTTEYFEATMARDNPDYTLLSKFEDRAAPVLMRHECDECGRHEFEVSPRAAVTPMQGSLSRGSLCPRCRGLKILRKKLEEEYGEQPYELLEPYIDVHTKIRVKKRDCRHEFEMKPGNMLNGVKRNRTPPCPGCFPDKIRKARLTDVNHYRKRLLERFGEIRYDFSDEDYLGLDKKCPHTCRKCGNTFDAIPNNVLTAHGSSSHYCPHCNNMVRDERPYRERCLEATEGRVEPLGVYVNRKTQLLHRCTTCGHSWECTPSNPLSGTGCPKCSRRIKESVGEMAVADLFRRAGLRVLTKDHSVLRRRELDVYLPDLALAVEYNGLFWHGERYKDSGYHLEKLEECRAAGVRLIQIFEDEWLLRREIVEEKLLVTAGAFSGRRINARECTVEEVGVSEKNALLEASHVQGADKSLLNLGLRTTTGELVAVMTLCARRAALGGKAQDGDVELSRYASLIGTSVRGGFGKLLAHLRRGYEFETITTYADRRWSDGAVYERSGFVLNHASAPNYWYIHRNNGERRLHRYGFRKQRLAKLFPDLYEESRTEREIMAEAGYFRVWDCGSLVFRYDNPGP